MSTILLQRPQAGTVFSVAPQADDNFHLDFVAEDATMTREGDTLIFTFEDGASIELTDFYSSFNSETMPEFIIEEATIPGEAFFAALGDDLMPAAGVSSTPTGSGTSQDFTQTELHGGLNSLNGLNAEGVRSTPTPQTAQNTSNQPPVDNNDNNPAPAPTDANTTTNTTNTRSVVNTTDEPNTSTPAPEGPSFSASNDVFVVDAGSKIIGNLLANDNLPEGTLVSEILAPEGWASTENEDGSVTFESADGSIDLTVQPNGDFELNTDIENIGFDDINFSYKATDTAGNHYDADITIGNNGDANLSVEHLEGGSAIVTNNDTGNVYEQDFASYKGDAEIGNQHVNGMLLGDGDDSITVETAVGSQTDPTYASKAGDDTFIYGDNLQNDTPGKLGDDTITVDTLDGTKIRADGNLGSGVEGGDDTVNVENMEGGSIIGDGWTLDAGSAGGDDIINVGTMNSGHIYGDGVTVSSAAKGGDDDINVGSIETTSSGYQNVIIDGDSGNDDINIGNIDTTSAGNQRVTIDGGIGDDYVSVGPITSTSGDSININGGEGYDIFNYDDSADNTMALSGNNIYIAGQGQINITNFEGIGAGGGDDLVKLYGSFDDIVVDGGEGMDVLLANASSKNEIEDMINDGNISNTEVIVLNNGLNNSSTTSTEDLFNKLEGEGVTKDENGLSFDDSWTKSESTVGNFDEYTSDDGDMTILVARTQMENTAS